MAEPFKNLLNAEVVQALGAHLQRCWPAFDRPQFEALALAGLPALALKARAHHFCDALEATLPGDFAAATGLMQAALAPPGDTVSQRHGEDGLAGWAVWPMTEYVARHGSTDVPRALAALHAMTQRFTAEWAVRPFLLHHPDITWATFARWASDPSPHVRRLVSEGSRPRLPWGLVLKPLVADPRPALPLLRRLQDDPSDYVRRSVANHLNDIAKDHPGLIVQWLADHLPGAPAQRQALLRHASRTLIKGGHAEVMTAWGVGATLVGSAGLTIAPRQVALGGEVTLAVELISGGKAAQRLVVDYAVHHVKANRRTTPKVFKGWNLLLAAGEHRALAKRHAVKPITTRVYYPGEHRVELRVNGQTVAEDAFWLSV